MPAATITIILILMAAGLCLFVLKNKKKQKKNKQPRPPKESGDPPTADPTNLIVDENFKRIKINAVDVHYF